MKNICFQMNRKAWVVMLFALCLAFPALAQKITVQGTVLDSTGEPLIGASVIPQGTTTGTATDFDGHFQLDVAPDATLVVSYVGCETQQVAVKGQTILKITLADNALVLDEVVAIGYGTVKKNDATGSVSTVKPSEVQAGLATSAQDLLVGQAPGVVVTSSGGPEGTGTIRIRGGSSLNASNDPLIVVDGVPLDNNSVQGMGNPLSMIPPDNIENITILKDASATAIYGSRASNGVIIITTKRGKSGKPQVNFSANMYVNTPRKTWDVLSASEYSEKIINYFGEGSAAANALGTSDTDWQDEVLRTTISSDYNLSVGGTAGWLPYRVAVNYTNNKGILKRSQMDRLTFGFNLTPEFLDHRLKIQANVKGYYIRNQFSDESALTSALASDPTRAKSIDSAVTFYDLDGNVTGTGLLWNGHNSWTSGTSYNINSVNNPMATMEDQTDEAKIWRSNGNLQIDYALKWLPELHFNLNLGYDVSQSKEHIYTDANSPLAWDNYNSDGAGTHYYVEHFKSNTLLDFYINYKKEFEKIYSNLDVTVGYSWQHFKEDGSNNGTEYTSNGFATPIDNGDGTYSIYESTQRVGTTYTDADATAWANHLQLLSFFGRVNYTLLDRYLFTFTLRGDATSRFSEDNRWGTFPSVALGWKISEEPFMKKTKDVLNELKLRLGWGITGQQDIGDYYPYLAVYTASVQGSNYVSLTNPGTLGNWNYINTYYPEGYDATLKWEETTTWNAGLDFGFLNNRITASVDYYYRETKDLLSYVTVAVGSATTNMMNQNIGSLENTGLEFSLTARPIVTKDFTWTVNYNVAWNKNKITKLNNDGSYITTGGISNGTGNTCQVQAVGHAAYSFYLYEQVYDENGDPMEGVYVDQNGDGVINDDDRIIRHSKDPKVTMTFGSNFNYKNWDFSFSLRASIGNYVYADVLANNTTLNSCFNNAALSNMIKTDYYFDGTINSTTGIALSDYWLRNASFLRCDNITLGYTWPDLLNNQLRLRLYGAVQNPFVITSYEGLDPEVFSGIDSSVYPKSITCTLGVVATF